MGTSEVLAAIDGMEGFAFEGYLVKLLKALGYKAEATRATGDYGCDILAEKDFVRWAIQAKRYSGPVGVGAIQQIVMGKAYYDADMAWVITTSELTRQALDSAKKLHVRITDRYDLAQMIVQAGMQGANAAVHGKDLSSEHIEDLSFERKGQIVARIKEINLFFYHILKAWDASRRPECFDRNFDSVWIRPSVQALTQSKQEWDSELQIWKFFHDYYRDGCFRPLVSNAVQILKNASDSYGIRRSIGESYIVIDRDSVTNEDMERWDSLYHDVVDSLLEDYGNAEFERMKAFFQLVNATCIDLSLKDVDWFIEEEENWRKMATSGHPEFYARSYLFYQYNPYDTSLKNQPTRKTIDEIEDILYMIDDDDELMKILPEMTDLYKHAIAEFSSLYKHI